MAYRPALRRVAFIGLGTALLLTALLSGKTPAHAATPLFGAPIAGPPGPGSWFIGQWYGNTAWAHDSPYPTGQGLHFGVDFNAPCGTTVQAIGDGTIFAVDGPYGSVPHNVVIAHADGIFSLYGHLLQPSTRTPGEVVKAGDPIALSGDPAGRCDLDPHLHLEIRRNMMRETTNPVPLLRIDWNRATAGIRRNGTTFVRDLDNPARWLTIADQPDVVFGGGRLNDYLRSWP